jgi:hypothetical protein
MIRTIFFGKLLTREEKKICHKFHQLTQIKKTLFILIIRHCEAHQWTPNFYKFHAL